MFTNSICKTLLKLVRLAESDYASHEPLWSDDIKFSPIAALGGFLESQNKEEALKSNIQKILHPELGLKNKQKKH